MKSFKIQSDKNSIPVSDFGYTLMDVLNFHKWYYQDKSNYDYIVSPFMTNNRNIIPIGTIEYVLKHVFKYHPNVEVIPLNKPKELQTVEFCGGHVFNYTNETKQPFPVVFPENKKFFCKSANEFKKFTDVITPVTEMEAGKYQLTEVLDFKSEYRAFFYKKQILDVRCYSGDFKTTPDFNKIYSMLKAWNNKPIAGTIDVGVTVENKTVLIECHNFFSCGLYGFNHKLLPEMFASWWLNLSTI